MSSAAIRGKEATLFLTVDQKRYTLLTKDFTVDHDFDLKMDSYIGNRTDLANPIFNGVNFSFSVDEDDAQAIELSTLLMARERAGLAPPKCALKVKYKFRKPGVGARMLVYSDATLAPGSRNSGGAKENISSSFKGFSPAEPLIISQ
jgi:hypothetical protein